MFHGELCQRKSPERTCVQPVQGGSDRVFAERERTHRRAAEGGGGDVDGAPEGESDHLRDPGDSRVVRDGARCSRLHSLYAFTTHVKRFDMTYWFMNLPSFKIVTR